MALPGGWVWTEAAIGELSPFGFRHKTQSAIATKLEKLLRAVSHFPLDQSHPFPAFIANPTARLYQAVFCEYVWLRVALVYWFTATLTGSMSTDGLSADAIQLCHRKTVSRNLRFASGQLNHMRLAGSS